MIVEMKHLTLLCVAREGVKALESLRDIGCVHLDLSSADSPDFASAKEELADAERAVRIVAKAAREVVDPAPKGEVAARLENAKSAALVEEILKVDAERQAAEDEAEALRQTVRKYAPFGDFDPALAESLRASGRQYLKLAERQRRTAIPADMAHPRHCQSDRHLWHER